MLATTADRVRFNTPDEVNNQIARRTELNINQYGRAGSQAIDR